MNLRLVVDGSSATIEGAHRYSLSRWWGDGDRVLWCMLNPSTADAQDDDPTIRKCIGFARRWGFDGIDVVNLFSWRATDPRGVRDNLTSAANSRTDEEIRALAAGSSVTIAGWGRFAGRPWVLGRAHTVLNTLHWSGTQVQCLGTNRDGSPRHPLMLSYSTAREPYDP